MLENSRSFIWPLVTPSLFVESLAVFSNASEDDRSAPLSFPVSLKSPKCRSIAICKWHLGGDKKFRSLERGGDDFYGFLHGARGYFPEKNPPYQTALMLNHMVIVHVNFKYLSDEFGDRAVGNIDRYKDLPFFLYLAFHAPHSPKDTPSEDMAILGSGKKIITELAAMTIARDQNVGNVLDAIDRNKLVDNPLVVLLSLMRWPGVLPNNVKHEKPVISRDFYASVPQNWFLTATAKAHRSYMISRVSCQKKRTSLRPVPKLPTDSKRNSTRGISRTNCRCGAISKSARKMSMFKSAPKKNNP